MIDVSAHDCRRIVYDNAAELYSIGVPASTR
jgi:hypothetical protein